MKNAKAVYTLISYYASIVLPTVGIVIFLTWYLEKEQVLNIGFKRGELEVLGFSWLIIAGALGAILILLNVLFKYIDKEEVEFNKRLRLSNIILICSYPLAFLLISIFQHLICEIGNSVTNLSDRNIKKVRIHIPDKIRWQLRDIGKGKTKELLVKSNYEGAINSTFEFENGETVKKELIGYYTCGLGANFIDVEVKSDGIHIKKD